MQRLAAQPHLRLNPLPFLNSKLINYTSSPAKSVRNVTSIIHKANIIRIVVGSQLDQHTNESSPVTGRDDGTAATARLCRGRAAPAGTAMALALHREARAHQAVPTPGSPFGHAREEATTFPGHRWEPKVPAQLHGLQTLQGWTTWKPLTMTASVDS